MLSVKLLAGVLMVALVSWAAIANVPTPPPGQIPMTVHAPHGVLPTIIHHTGHDTVNAYAAAFTHADVLAEVPCTCGCMPMLHHRNNLDCYIQEILPDGTVAFDTHGLYCLVCQWITFDVVEAADAGADHDELRRMVKEKYGPHI